MFTEPCEAIFNEHPRVYRAALVGVGSAPDQRPAIVVEPESGHYPPGRKTREQFRQELREMAAANSLTSPIKTFLFHRSLPVDTRHNVKISREALASWAERKLRN
jgi:acyl-coenzyme A synthetase/AMP-(fatty) acid ligase